MVHGLGQNFYSPPLPQLAAILAHEGHPTLVLNTRGHDWIVRGASDGPRFAGAAYETTIHAMLDLDAAVTQIRHAGFARPVLIGHSSGVAKCLIYAAERPKVAIGGIACVAPRPSYYSARAHDAAFRRIVDRAKALVARGDGSELMWVPGDGGRLPFSAATVLSKYGPDDQRNLRRHAASVTCDILALVGGRDTPETIAYAKDLAHCAGARGQYRAIDGADHYFSSHVSELAVALLSWFRDKIPRAT